MNRYPVIMWHGYDGNLAIRLRDICEEKVDSIPDGTSRTSPRFIFEGSLEEFAERWQGLFMVNCKDKWIAVTQFNSFSPR